jgi:hypothetical protein
VAFAQKPGEATITVTMERRKPMPFLVSMLVQEFLTRSSWDAAYATLVQLNP